MLLLLLPVFLALQLLHWAGFVLDEVFFRGYRKIAIRQPLFVLGPPRSGTTYLHTVLASDSQFTTFTLWECLLGLSVTAKMFVLGLKKIDGLIGRPGARLLTWAISRLLGDMDEVHPFRLAGPEEDFLCLLPLNACFIQVVPFPRAKWLWRLARFDQELTAGERNRMLDYYRGCIQKHLYVFGADKTFLSKNASFAGMAHSLLDEFPDARIVSCMRDPLSTVPSQLSSLLPGLSACGFTGVDKDFGDRLTELLRFYYLNLASARDRNPTRMTFVENRDLRTNPEQAVRSAFARIGLEVRPALRRQLRIESQRSERSASRHRYSLDDFGLDEAKIMSQFDSVYRHFSFPARETSEAA